MNNMIKDRVVKCQGCGRKVEIPEDLPEFFCQVCGACNIVPDGNGTFENPLDCIPPKRFEWKLPAGKTVSASGETIYITAQGSHVTKQQFKDMYKCDPELVLKNMRRLGIDGIEGYKNLSTLRRG